MVLAGPGRRAGSCGRRFLPGEVYVGAWGTAIFADDLACEVRDAYRQFVADGSAGPEATDRLLRQWNEVLEDEEEGPLFWLALAATQWDCGRLEPRVKAKALAILDQGASLALWSEGGESRMLKQRQAALAKLRDKLQSPPPAARRIRKPPQNECPWAVGEVLAFRLPSGKSLLFHLAAKDNTSRVGCLPIFALLDWVGKRLPSVERIKNLPLKPCRGGTAPYLFAVMRLARKDFPTGRIVPLGLHRKPHQRKIRGGYMLFFWKTLDEDLKAEFGFE
jgi:hypothetical protein